MDLPPADPVKPALAALDAIISNVESVLTPTPPGTSSSSAPPAAAAASADADESAAPPQAADEPAGHAKKGKESKKKKKKGKSSAAQPPPQQQQQRVEAAQLLQCDVRVGRVASVAPHPEADALYALTLSFGDALPPRSVVAGLRAFVPEGALLGRQVVAICNLKPRKLRGVESAAMILAGSVVSPAAAAAAAVGGGGDDDDGDGGAAAAPTKERVAPLAPPPGAQDGAVVGARGVDGERAVVDGKFVSSKVWDKVVSRLVVAGGVATYDGLPLVVGDGSVTCDLPDGAEIH